MASLEPSKPAEEAEPTINEPPCNLLQIEQGSILLKQERTKVA